MRMNRKYVLIFFIVLVVVYSGSGQVNRQIEREAKGVISENRTALVIGNSNYSSAPLRNPVNDAKDMATTLKTLGFEVFSYTDLDQNGMKKAIRDFGAKLRTKGGVGLFYYAGHGVQVKGTNYLIPVGAEVNSEEEVEYESVDVGLVMAQMESAKNNMNVVILDACRNNPFARSYRSVDKGLASIDAPSGTLIAYSTAPGSVASDGTGRNGIYTQEFLKAIRTDGLDIEDVFKRVRVNVRNATSDKQTPWESSSLTGNFYFAGGSNVKTETKINIPEAKPNISDGEVAFWKSIENSDDPQDFESFLKQYPESVYSPVARNNLRRLNQKKSSVKEETNQTSTNNQASKSVSDNIINGRAIKLVKPNFPRLSLETLKANEPFYVQVTVDEQGNVINATVTSGKPSLRERVREAAMQSTFEPTYLNGNPVKFTGVIVYKLK